MPRQSILAITGLLLAFVLLFLLSTASLAAPTIQEEGPLLANSLTRQREVAVAKGSAVPLLVGAPTDDLFAYSFDGTAWQQIPFQIDEVNPISNTYTITGDGTFDAIDEFSFLAKDAGQQAPAGQWIADPDSTLYPRYELQVTDPLYAGQTAWVYLYRSPTLAPSFGQVYIDVNPNTVHTPYFDAQVDFQTTLGLTVLKLNGGANDLLDQSHISIKGKIAFIVPVQYCEQDLLSLIDPGTFGTGLPDIDRPVRYISGPVAAPSAVVNPASLQTVLGPVNLTEIAAGINIPTVSLTELRISLDLLKPANTGFAPARFYANTLSASGVAIDGVADTVPATLASWTQINGSTGSIVQLNNVQATGTTVYNYYIDSASATAADCHGTDGAYGESGVRIAPFAGQVTLDQRYYFTAVQTQGNGALYQSYAANPLQLTPANQMTCYFADVQPDATHTNPALCDDDVDLLDILTVAACWNQSIGTANCPASLDLNRDTLLDTADVTIAAELWKWQR